MVNFRHKLQTYSTCSSPSEESPSSSGSRLKLLFMIQTEKQRILLRDQSSYLRPKIACGVQNQSVTVTRVFLGHIKAVSTNHQSQTGRCVVETKCLKLQLVIRLNVRCWGVACRRSSAPPSFPAEGETTAPTRGKHRAAEVLSLVLHNTCRMHLGGSLHTVQSFHLGRDWGTWLKQG